MPRVSRQHEQEVRDRIVRAAIRVFGDRGFHRATMQDIVRASGLSVGAIYTYFNSKSDLILAGCDLITDQEMGELRARLAGVTDYRERVATAVGFFFDSLEVERSRGTSMLMTLAWAEADSDPAIREMLRRRRGEIVTSALMLLQEGVVRRELPAWLDVASLARGLSALLDGIIIEVAEEGPAFRRSDAERRVLGVIETILAAAGSSASVPIEPAPPRAYESAREHAAAS